MSTSLVSLPVVPGGPGAGAEVSALQADKIIILSNDLVGTVNIEARAATGGWCTVASFTDRTLDKKIVVCASEMRVNSSNGSVGSVQVMAERGLVRFADIPAPPVNGAGAPLDMIQFGCLTTVILTGLAPLGKGVNIEISADGINWEQIAKTFMADGCQTFDASSRFIRAAGLGATATISVASQEPAISALTAPVGMIVFRPGATGADAPGGNVYTTWEDTYAAIEAVRNQGPHWLFFDSRFSTDLDFNGSPACEIPVGTWDMFDCWWWGDVGANVNLVDGANIIGLDTIRGDRLFINYDGETPGSAPFKVDTGGFGMLGSRTQFQNSNPLAAPMFECQGFFFLAWCGNETFGRMVSGGAPLIDLNDGFVLWAGNAGFWTENILTDTSGPATGFFENALRSDGANASFPQGTYQNPALPGTAGIVLQVDHRDRHLVSALQAGAITARYNELIQADATAPGTVVTLPFADPASGERVVVKDALSLAGSNTIAVVAQAGETIDGGVGSPDISVNGQAKIYISDGAGNWVSLTC